MTCYDLPSTIQGILGVASPKKLLLFPSVNKGANTYLFTEPAYGEDPEWLDIPQGVTVGVNHNGVWHDSLSFVFENPKAFEKMLQHFNRNVVVINFPPDLDLPPAPAEFARRDWRFLL